MPIEVPESYTGRVSGKFAGSQLVFTLRNISKSDGRLYACLVENGEDDIFDVVKLVVEGRNFFLLLCCKFIH